MRKVLILGLLFGLVVAMFWFQQKYGDMMYSQQSSQQSSPQRTNKPLLNSPSTDTESDNSSRKTTMTEKTFNFDGDSQEKDGDKDSVWSVDNQSNSGKESFMSLGF